MIFQLTQFKDLTPSQQSRLTAMYGAIYEGGNLIKGPWVQIDDLYVCTGDLRTSILERAIFSAKQILKG
jgi:hypothetical protein